ncbi:hypothetical protein [Saccharopolyspora pogona]|uniref:hypothetical protein n=1 Tax=Saccharopolyspora pogona TaxID=333966 RepID=UPI001CC25C1E|nr:hypothetical protein [Saccharopolyspora pogona]
MTTGMEGLAAGASVLAGRAEGLRAAVDNGQLVMDPAAAEAVAKVYKEKANAVRKARSDSERLILNGAFGDCFIGRDMEKKFRDKVNAPGGLVAILTDVERILKNMAQAYRDSARDMRNVDEDHAREIKRSV